MALEANFRWIDDLVPSNPAVNDPVNQGDDHLRGIKNCVTRSVGGDNTVVSLKLDNVAQIEHRIGNARIRSTPAEVATFSFYDNALAVERAAVQANSSLDLAGKVDGMTIRAIVQDAVNGAHTQLEVTPGAGVTLGHINDTRLRTDATGVLAFGNAIFLQNTADEAEFIGAANSVGGVALVVDPTTGAMRLVQTSSAGVAQDSLASWSRNGDFTLLRNDVPVLASDGDDTVKLIGGATGTFRFRNAADSATYGQISAQSAELNLRSESVLRLQSDGGSRNILLTAPTTTSIYGETSAEFIRVGSAADRLQSNSSAWVENAAGIAHPIGFNAYPQSATATSRALVPSDIGNMVRCTTTLTITLNAVRNEAYFRIYNSGTGVVTIAQGSGVTLSWASGAGIVNGNRSLAAGSVCTVWQRTSNNFVIWSGAGLS